MIHDSDHILVPIGRQANAFINILPAMNDVYIPLAVPDRAFCISMDCLN